MRGSDDRKIIALEGIDDRDVAAFLRNQLVFVPSAEEPPLPEGEYYHHQLIGLKVQTPEGRDLGALSEILLTGANDVYVVLGPDGSELLLPAIGDVVLNIDLELGRILVNLIPGL